MADAKWIDDLHERMPAGEAARLVLTLRLGVVRDKLPLAVEQADADVEHVHQLRVSTRRAAAALRIFESVLPGSLERQARKTLRRLRRAAGAARDWDVFLAMLATRLARADARQRRGLDLLLGLAHGQRSAAQAQLIGAAEHDRDRLPGLIDDIAAETEGNGPALRELAATTLTDLVHDLEEAAASDLQPYEHLHQVRILGKKLRYAMEVFASIYPDSFRERYYRAVAEMQDILGDANDSHVAALRLADIRDQLQKTQPKLWPAYQPGLDGLLRFHQRRMPQLRQKFQRWWLDWRRSGEEHTLAHLVTSPATR